MGQQPDPRKGDQTLKSASILMVSSGLWSLLRRPHGQSLTLSTTQPQVSGGSQSVQEASKLEKVPFLAGTQAARAQSQSCLTLDSGVAPGTFWGSEHFPAPSFRVALRTPHPWDMPTEADTPWWYQVSSLGLGIPSKMKPPVAPNHGHVTPTVMSALDLWGLTCKPCRGVELSSQHLHREARNSL